MKKIFLMFCFFIISFFIYASDEPINIEGAWASVEGCKWMMENNSFNLSVRDDKSLKWEKDDGFIIELPKKNKKGLFGLIGISNRLSNEEIHYLAESTPGWSGSLLSVELN